MAVTTTPLGFQKPDGNEPIRNGDNVISANAQKAEDLITSDRVRLTAAENAAAALTPRVTATETKNATQDSRLDAIETTNASDSDRLSTAEAKNRAQDGRLSSVETTNTTQDATLANHKSRVESLETLGGLAPGNVSDATVRDLIANPATTTAAELKTTIAAAIPTVSAPAPSGADDTAALNSALTAAAGKTIELKAGATYRITNTLTVPSGTSLDLNGATIDATGIPAGQFSRERFGVRADGSMGSSVLVGAAVTKWSRTITALSSTTGLAAGDLIRVRNFENPGPGGTKTVIDKGELNVIASVDSATKITLAYGVLFDYANDGNLVVAKVNAVKDITIRNGTLLMAGIGSAHTGIAFQYARNVNVENVEVIGGEDTGILLAHTWRGNVTGGHVADSTSPAAGVGTAGYGVGIEDASRFIQVSGVQFDNCRSFVNGGGLFPASNVDIMWNQGRRAAIIGFGAHEPCFYWKYSNNTVIGGGGGIQFRGQHGTVENNTIIDCAGNGVRFYADEGITAQDDVVIRGNHVENCGSGIVVDGIVVNSTAVESIKRGVKIEDNRIFKSAFDAILLKNFDTASITGNLIDGAINNGINVTGVSAANPSRNLVIARNQIKNVTLVGIKAKWVNDIDLAVGSIDTTGQQGILLDTCNGTSTCGGSIRRTALNGLRILGGAGHVVTPGTMKDFGAATDGIVAIAPATDVSILGGVITATRYGIYTSGADRVIISGVNAEGSVGVGGAKIRVESAVTYRLAANIGVSNPAN